jgi:hypothetical protein
MTGASNFWRSSAVPKAEIREQRQKKQKRILRAGDKAGDIPAYRGGPHGAPGGRGDSPEMSKIRQIFEASEASPKLQLWGSGLDFF